MIGKMLVSGLLELTLSILIAFFLFRDGESAAEGFLIMVERVADARGRRLLNLTGDTVRGVVYGILGTALVQAVMAGIGYLIAGVPEMPMASNDAGPVHRPRVDGIWMDSTPVTNEQFEKFVKENLVACGVVFASADHDVPLTDHYQSWSCEPLIRFCTAVGCV